MTEINGLDERISELKILYQEAERLNLKDKAIELLVDINYLEELRELRRKKEPKWIPVGERLPKEGAFVLASYNSDEGAVVVTTYYNKYGFARGLMTAWMPLPEPYEEDKK